MGDPPSSLVPEDSGEGGLGYRCIRDREIFEFQTEDFMPRSVGS